jgi:gliding motility-associated-like protein
LALSAVVTPTTAIISWTGPAGFHSNLASPVINPLNVSNTGYYDCYCTFNGCGRKDSIKATVNAMPGPIVSDTFICGNGVSINATYPNAINYLWSDGNTDSVHTLNTSGTYWITYTLSTSCIFTDTFHITIKENVLIDTLPNIVTPNNDNKNDFIDFGKYQFSTFQIDIYNRWGNKIFESSDPKCIWYPTCVDGTYFYIINYTIECGVEDKQKIRRGFITVIR